MFITKAKLSIPIAMSAEEVLREKIKTKKYSFNIVKIEPQNMSTFFRVVFFINQPAHPISQTITFDFQVSQDSRIKFKTENNKFYYSYDQVDLEQIIDREYQQKLKFEMPEQ